MPDFVRKTPPSTAAAAAPESGSPGRERRAEPRLPTPAVPVEERREITDAITLPASGRTIDRFFHAVRMTLGVSPAAAALARAGAPPADRCGGGGVLRDRPGVGFLRVSGVAHPVASR